MNLSHRIDQRSSPPTIRRRKKTLLKCNFLTCQCQPICEIFWLHGTRGVIKSVTKMYFFRLHAFAACTPSYHVCHSLPAWKCPCHRHDEDFGDHDQKKSRKWGTAPAGGIKGSSLLFMPVFPRQSHLPSGPQYAKSISIQYCIGMEWIFVKIL